MFTKAQSLCSRVWQALVNPTVRLKADFPWTFAKMAKHYVVATLLYMAGSFLPLVLLLATMFVLGHYNRPLLTSIIGPNMENALALTVGLTVVSFLCGFGLQVWYIARVLRAEGLSLRGMLSLNLDSLNGSWWSATWRAALTVAVGLVLAQLVHLLPFLPEPRQEIAQFMGSLHGWQLVAVGLLATVAAPFFEEVVFRGFLFNMLRTQFSRGWVSRVLRGQNAADWAASIVSGAVFAAAHLEPSAMPGLFLFGVLLAQLYRRSGSLVCPMLAHAINNSIGVALIILSQVH